MGGSIREVEDILLSEYNSGNGNKDNARTSYSIRVRGGKDCEIIYKKVRILVKI